jgi:hypothetical protein
MEQICKHHGSGKRLLKRIMSRYMRRIARRLLDAAPVRKSFRGYTL